jgi:serine/threonine protein kinase
VVVIHWDLKTQNILLKPDASNPNGFRPIVLDFGLCGLLESGETSTSMLAGTPSRQSLARGLCFVSESTLKMAVRTYPKTISRTALAAVRSVKTGANAHRLMGEPGFRIGSLSLSGKSEDA